MFTKTLNTLIRYKKQIVDEQRRRMVSLQTQREQFLQRSKELAEELHRELELASSQPEMGGFFGNFAGRIRERQEELAAEVAKLEKQMEKLAEEIRESFGEMKRFEILRERRIDEAKKLANKREIEQLDEVALLRHSRKEEN